MSEAAILRMQDLAERLHRELDQFDTETSNDEGNEDHLTAARLALEELEGHLGDLVP